MDVVDSVRDLIREISSKQERVGIENLPHALDIIQLRGPMDGMIFARRHTSHVLAGIFKQSRDALMDFSIKPDSPPPPAGCGRPRDGAEYVTVLRNSGHIVQHGFA